MSDTIRRMSERYQTEMAAAIAAVKRACVVCRAVQADLVTAATLEKRDKSPVTVADFASQAVICHALAAAFPDDPVVGEEGAAELRGDDAAELRGKVVDHVNAALQREQEADHVLALIDRGGFDPQQEAGPNDRGRYWTLDPIDGTKGFLRGEQYAVALALIEDGRVVLGVLGCPNLPVESDAPAAGTGMVLSAVRGSGAASLVLDEPDALPQPIHTSRLSDPSAARFCESVESGHTDQGASVRIAEALGITAEPFRIDSQCKYAAVARGDAQIYLRLPTRADYREKVWDHAAGMIVVEEAGGMVTDVEGKPLDFTHGRALEANRGVIATCGSIHREVITAVRAAVG
jgi:3'(2'), 5'-bisphosphate nucleotidase